MLLKALILILLLILAPYQTGLMINGMLESKQRSMGVSYISGFLVLLAVFQLVAVPIVFLDAWGFDKIIKLFTAISAILAGGGTVYAMHSWRRGNNIWHYSFSLKDKSRAERIQWIMVLILIGFQLLMALTHASFDGDDAYYVVQSVMADETDTLYRILPYTGYSTSLDYRHSMAVFPLWIAYLARMTGIHATIISHTILPLILIPLTYWIYLEVGKQLFKDKKEQLPAFMILVCALQIFGNTSIYTGSTFLLMRTWQGKSMLANVVIPAIFMVLLWIVDREEEKRNKAKGLWILLFIINIVAAMMSTASVFLDVVLLGVMAVVLAVREKSPVILLKVALTCVPCGVYGLMYMVL
ncbi:MAG: hypothetical protein IJP31_04980 [Lachnospiraceae bacterium]|nr:hypothetical protein [Lachnospiraceae bacterium]